MKTESEQLALAKKAVFHVLDAIQYDPRKYWLMGEGTGSFDALTSAAAAFWNEDQDVVKQKFVPDEQKYADYVREVEEQKKILDAKTEDVAAASIVDLPAIPRCPVCGGDVNIIDEPVYFGPVATCQDCRADLKLVEMSAEQARR